MGPVEERMGVTMVFNAVGVDKAKFLTYANKVKRTLGDWGEDWAANAPEATKKLRSPYLEQEFTAAHEAGIIPDSAKGISGSWSSLSENGEAKNLNLVHIKNIDCTNVDDLTRAEMLG